jgi:hypothetical protein
VYESNTAHDNNPVWYWFVTYMLLGSTAGTWCAYVNDVYFASKVVVSAQ